MVKRDYINIMATITYSPQVTSLVRTVLKLMPMTSLVRMGLKQYVSKDRRIVCEPVDIHLTKDGHKLSYHLITITYA